MIIKGKYDELIYDSIINTKPETKLLEIDEHIEDVINNFKVVKELFFGMVCISEDSINLIRCHNDKTYQEISSFIEKKLRNDLDKPIKKIQETLLTLIYIVTEDKYDIIKENASQLFFMKNSFYNTLEN